MHRLDTSQPWQADEQVCTSAMRSDNTDLCGVLKTNIQYCASAETIYLDREKGIMTSKVALQRDLHILRLHAMSSTLCSLLLKMPADSVSMPIKTIRCYSNIVQVSCSVQIGCIKA